MRLPERILVIAPHPDDEVLMCAGVIRRAVMQNAHISVAVITNGDYLCPDSSQADRRLAETIDALTFLGMKEQDIYLMGYPDTGMEPEVSFLNRLYNTNDMEEIFPTERGETTYGITGGKQDFRFERSGTHSLITKGNFMGDLYELFQITQPKLVITSSTADTHGDHVALNHLVCDAVRHLYNDNESRPEVWESLIHSHLGDDVWPQPNAPNSDFAFVPGLEDFGLSWEKRIRIPLPDEMLGRSMENHIKYQAIQKYYCIVPEIQSYFKAFVKREEIFWSTIL